MNDKLATYEFMIYSFIPSIRVEIEKIIQRYIFSFKRGEIFEN